MKYTTNSQGQKCAKTMSYCIRMVLNVCSYFSSKTTHFYFFDLLKDKINYKASLKRPNDCLFFKKNVYIKDSNYSGNLCFIFLLPIKQYGN
jgi:hypothetical protein